MKFWEAMKALEEGKKVRQPHWLSGTYIHIQDHYITQDSGNTAPTVFHIRAIMDGWELYEEPGHDWAWAKEQLRRFNYVQRKSWNSMSIFYHHTNDLIYMEMDGTERPYVTDLDDQDATDWVLA
jgi:hypothetical protein